MGLVGEVSVCAGRSAGFFFFESGDEGWGICEVLAAVGCFEFFFFFLFFFAVFVLTAPVVVPCELAINP